MDDDHIIDMFWKKNENAVYETDRKYGAFLKQIANNILSSQMDAEEILQDTYLSAWQKIPPERPLHLKAYLGKIIRNLSLKKVRDMNTAKRGGGKIVQITEELSDICEEYSSVSEIVETRETAQVIDHFLRSLPIRECDVFVCRYWYYDSISDISSRFNMGESRVKMMLLRTRKKLAKYLEKEGICL